MKWIALVLLMVFAVGCSTSRKSGKASYSGFMCALRLSQGDWEDGTGVVIKSIDSSTQTIKLSDKISYMTGGIDGKPEVPHKVKIPANMQRYEIKVQIKRDTEIGWEKHESYSVEATVLDSKTNKIIQGPIFARTTAEAKVAQKHPGPKYAPYLKSTVNNVTKPFTYTVSCTHTFQN